MFGVVLGVSRMSHVGRHFEVAIVLHGRMGNIAPLLPGAPPRATRSLDGAASSVASAALCAFSLERHVIAANAEVQRFDVFGHSWSPEIGAALDALYAPTLSVHERGIPLSRFRCPAPQFEARYCHRTVSHLLGIARALALKRRHEVARGAKYDAVFLSRWDVLWKIPLRLPELPGWRWAAEKRRRSVWLPRICAPVARGDRAGFRMRQAICGGAPSAWLASQAAHECSPAARACQHDMTREVRHRHRRGLNANPRPRPNPSPNRLQARELYVMDWWLVLGSSADADEFADGMSARFAEHGQRIASTLAASPRNAIAMGHAWFGAQLLWTMNATLWCAPRPPHRWPRLTPGARRQVHG